MRGRNVADAAQVSMPAPALCKPDQVMRDRVVADIAAMGEPTSKLVIESLRKSQFDH